MAGRISGGPWSGSNEIASYGAYYDAIGNVLNNDGTPSGQYVGHDRRMNSSDGC
jgi:hypothetical protein